MRMNFYHLTEVGRVRKKNEDSLLIAPEFGLFGVADGCGGHPGGEHASRLAVEAMRFSFSNAYPDVHGGMPDILNRVMVHGFDTAANALKNFGNYHPSFRHLATTLSTIAIYQDVGVIGHIGDSSIYRVNTNKPSDKRVVRITERHKDKRGFIQALNAKESPKPQLQYLRIVPFDCILLCSDGLTDHFKDDESELSQMLTLPDPRGVCEMLRLFAMHNGGHDNISIVMLNFYP